ncbi:hypothetical protein GCM10007380_29630 [Gottfriedia solisilvae]|uniref:Uncharacterized protein n=1 Tax=Gottfriedia solisilvae TaxID=1516104 RepID=A0A8J3AN49_9BACI|nr:hypothetical protein GCM10007380_29630 [Gottfriedia solisilvae]
MTGKGIFINAPIDVNDANKDMTVNDKVLFCITSSLLIFQIDKLIKLNYHANKIYVNQINYLG